MLSNTRCKFLFQVEVQRYYPNCPCSPSPTVVFLCTRTHIYGKCRIHCALWTNLSLKFLVWPKIWQNTLSWCSLHAWNWWVCVSSNIPSIYLPDHSDHFVTVRIRKYCISLWLCTSVGRKGVVSAIPRTCFWLLLVSSPLHSHLTSRHWLLQTLSSSCLARSYSSHHLTSHHSSFPHQPAASFTPGSFVLRSGLTTFLASFHLPTVFITYQIDILVWL